MTCLYPHKCPNRVETTTWNEVSHGKRSWICGCTGPLEAVVESVCALGHSWHRGVGCRCKANPDECPPGTHSMFDFCPGREVCQGEPVSQQQDEMDVPYGRTPESRRDTCRCELYEWVDDALTVQRGIGPRDPDCPIHSRAPRHGPIRYATETTGDQECISVSQPPTRTGLRKWLKRWLLSGE